MAQGRSLAEGECRRVWSGSLCDKSRSLGQVELFWYTSEKAVDFPVPLGKDLKMDKKMPLERFQRTFPLPVCKWEDNGALKQDPYSGCDQLYYCQLKEVSFAGSRRRKSVTSYLHRQKVAGLGSVGECGKVYFLPTCSLTHHIGLTTDTHPIVIHVIFVLDGCLYSDLCSLTTLIGVHLQLVNSGRVDSGVCIIGKGNDREQSDQLSSGKSSHKSHFDLPVKDSDCILLDAVPPGLGCLGMTENGMRKRKKRLTKQQRRHPKWEKNAVVSANHTSHDIATTVDASMLTYSRRRVGHRSLESSKKREGGVHAYGSESQCRSDSSLLLKSTVVADEMELCESEDQMLKLIVRVPLTNVDPKTVGESSDQDSSHTGTQGGSRGMMCVGAKDGHSLRQEMLENEECATWEQVGSGDCDVDEDTTHFSSYTCHQSEPALSTLPQDLVIQEEIVTFATSPSPWDDEEERGDIEEEGGDIEEEGGDIEEEGGDIEEEGGDIEVEGEYIAVNTTQVGVSVALERVSHAAPFPALVISKSSCVPSNPYENELSINHSFKLHCLDVTSEQEVQIPEGDMCKGMEASLPGEGEEEEGMPKRKIDLSEYKKRKQQQKVDDAFTTSTVSCDGSVLNFEALESAVSDKDVQDKLPDPEQLVAEVTPPVRDVGITQQLSNPDTEIASAFKNDSGKQPEEDHLCLEGMARPGSISTLRTKRATSLQELSSSCHVGPGVRDPRSGGLRLGGIGHRGDRRSEDSVRPSSFAPTAATERLHNSPFSSPVGSGPGIVVTVKSPPSSDHPSEIVTKQVSISPESRNHCQSTSKKKDQQHQTQSRFAPECPPAPPLPPPAPPLPPPLPEEPAPVPLPPPPLPETDPPPPEPPPNLPCSPLLLSPQPSPLVSPPPLFPGTVWYDRQIFPMPPFLTQQWAELYLHHQQHQGVWNAEQCSPLVLNGQHNQPPHSIVQSHFSNEEGELEHGDCEESNPQNLCNGLDDLGSSSVASEVSMLSECATCEDKTTKTDTEHDKQQTTLISCGEAAIILPDQGEPAKEVHDKSLTPVETSHSVEDTTAEAPQSSPRTQQIQCNHSAVHHDCMTVGVQVNLLENVDEGGAQPTPSMADRSCQVSSEDLPQPQDAVLEQLDVEHIVCLLVERVKDCRLMKGDMESGQFLQAVSGFEDRLRQDIKALLDFAPMDVMPQPPHHTEMDDAVGAMTVEEQSRAVSTPPVVCEEDLEVSRINSLQEAQFDVVSPPSGSPDVNATPSFDSSEINALSLTAEMASASICALQLNSFDKKVSSSPPPLKPAPATVLDSSDKTTNGPQLPVRHAGQGGPVVHLKVQRLIEESKAGMCKKREESLSFISEQESHSHTSKRKDPHSHSSERKESHTHTSERKDPHSRSSERKESHSHTSERKDPHSRSSERKESHSHTSEWKDPHPHSSERKESHTHTSERKDPHSRSSERKESHTHTSERKESHTHTSERKDTHSHTSERKDPHSRSSERKDTHSHTSERKDTHSHTSEQKDPHSRSSEQKDPHSRSEQKDPHSCSSERKDPHSRSSEQKDPHSRSSEQKDPHSPISKHKESVSDTSEHKEPVSPISEQQEFVPHTCKQKDSVSPISEQKESVFHNSERKESLSPISEEEFEEYDDDDDDDDGNAEAQPTKPPLCNHTYPRIVDKNQTRKAWDPSETSNMPNGQDETRRDMTATSRIGSSSVVKPASATLESDRQEPQARDTSLEMGPPMIPLSHHTTPTLKEDANEESEGNSVEQVATGISPPLAANTSGTVAQRFKRKTHTAGSSLSLSSLLGESNSKPPSYPKSEPKVDDAEKVPPPSKPKKPCQWSTFLHPNWMEKDSELPFKSTQYVDPTGAAKKKKKKKKKTSEVDQHVDSVLEQYQEESAKAGVVVVSKGPQQNAAENSKPKQWKYGGTLRSVDGKQKPAGAKGEKSSPSPRKAVEKHNGHDHLTSHSDSDSSRHNGRARKSVTNTERSSSAGRGAPTYKRTPEKRTPTRSHSPRRRYSSEDHRHSRSGRDRSRSRSPRHGRSPRRPSPSSHQYSPNKSGLRKRQYSRSPLRAREKSLDLSSSYHSATSEDESPRSKRYRSASEHEQHSSIETLSSVKWTSLNNYTHDEPPSSSIFDGKDRDPKRIAHELWAESSSTSDTAIGGSLHPSSWDSSPLMLAEDGFDSGRYSRSVTPPQGPEPRNLVPIQPYMDFTSVLSGRWRQ